MSKIKKRNLTIVGILLMLLLCVSFVTFNGPSIEAHAASAPSLDSIIFTDPSAFQFTIISTTDKTCSVKLVDKSIENVRVPKTAKINDVDYTITEVASNGFSSTSGLKTVIFLKTLRKIGSAAFQNCAALELVYAPEVKEIGMSAFALCPNLKDVIFPTTLETIGASIFMMSNTKVHARFETAQNGWALNWNSGNACTNHDFNERNIDGNLWMHDFIYEEVEQANPLSGMASVMTTSTITRLAPIQPFMERESQGYLEIPATDFDILPYTFIDGTFEAVVILSGSSPINIWTSAFTDITAKEGFTINRDVTYNCGFMGTSITPFNTIDTPFITLPTPQKIVSGMFFSNTIENIHFRTTTGINYENKGVVKLPDSIPEIDFQAFESTNNIKHLYIPSNVEVVGNQAFAQWNNTQTIYVPFFSEAHANSVWGTGWKSLNFANIEYMGEMSVALQPPSDIITDIGTYNYSFEFKIPVSYTFEQFTFEQRWWGNEDPFANILNLNLVKTDRLAGDYRIRRWDYSLAVKSGTTGGCDFEMEMRAIINNAIASSIRTNRITVHRFIRTAAEFNAADFKYSDYTNYSYCLLNNINLGTITVTTANDYNGIKAINKVGLYGNNYTITYTMNVPTMPASTNYNLALFSENSGKINGLKTNATYTVSNWTSLIQNGVEQAGYIYCGGIAANNMAEASIENCEVSINATMKSPNANIGGIVYQNEGKISGCVAKGSITTLNTGIRYVPGIGGIAALNGYGSNAEIIGCTNKATISGWGNIGGIVAQNECKIANCINEGNLTLNCNYYVFEAAVGGICGSNGLNNRTLANVTSCQNTSTIKFGQNIADLSNSEYITPAMAMIVGRNYGGNTQGNLWGGSIDYGSLTAQQRIYAGYREIGRNG